MLAVDKPTSDFGVRMGDRIYPALDQQDKAFAPRAPETIDDDSPKQLCKNLADAIRELLPFLSLTANISDKAALFGQYVDSVSILERCRGEVIQLFQAMIETVLDFDSAGTLSTEARSEILAQILKDADVQISHPENLATAEIAALKPVELQVRLQASLSQSIDKLVTELMDRLGVLVDRSVAGLVHWTSPNTVKYHFFRRRAAETGVQTTRKRGRVRRRSAEEARGDFRQWKRVNKRKTTTQVTCWLVHHKHDTVNAIHTSLENSKVIMPEFVQALVKQIPEWMRPSICVIDGYLIREQIFERELCKHESTEVELEEELIHGYEPAVCLGPYVLTGWGPREIDAEVERRATEAAGAPQLQSVRFWGVCALACQVFCVLFAHLGVLALSVLLFVGGMVSIALWTSQASKVACFQLSEWQRQRICFEFLTLLGGLQLLFTPLSISLVLCGLAFVVIGLTALKMDQSILSRLVKLQGT